jgi:hypothetical protein
MTGTVRWWLLVIARPAGSSPACTTCGIDRQAGSLPMLAGMGGWVPLGRCRLKGLPVSSV